MFIGFRIITSFRIYYLLLCAVLTTLFSCSEDGGVLEDPQGSIAGRVILINNANPYDQLLNSKDEESLNFGNVEIQILTKDEILSTTIPNDSGEFVFSGIPKGEYLFVFNKPGYGSYDTIFTYK